MATEGHLELSDFIKSIHQNLRQESKKIGSEQAWQQHCNDKEKLEKYAHAMRELACQYWERNIDGKTKSRIQWTINTCLYYFEKQMFKYRNKEMTILWERSIVDYEFNKAYLSEVQDLQTLKLLDVGSCYNPFEKCKAFEVTAIDIAPATEAVLKCDFLNVKIGTTLVQDDNELHELPKAYFDVVVFSLLLEYLPTPSQRFACCKRAYKVLQKEGLLVVITPDSNHIGVNTKYMKSWRYVLAKIGFSRIKYEKYRHIHCMAFRKVTHKLAARKWAEFHQYDQLFEEIYIPQDFNKSNEDLTIVNKCDIDHSDGNRTQSCVQSIFLDYTEFPEFGIFE